MKRALLGMLTPSSGLVTPYLEEVQSHIVENYEQSGYRCVAERHLGRRVN